MAKVYEWRCTECDRQVESPCQTGLFCDSQNHPEPVPMKRIYSLAGVSFKGKGFYRNDSRSE